MKKKYGSIGLSIFALALLIVGTAFWIRVFYTSIREYRSPLDASELAPQQPVLSAPTSKMVIVLVSGLGYDDSQALNLPVLDQLQRAGATAAVESIPPTYSQTAWATLISGAPR